VTLARALNRQVDRWLRAATAPDAPAQAAAAKRAIAGVSEAGGGRCRGRHRLRPGARQKNLAAPAIRAAPPRPILAARGVPAELVNTALPQDDEAELAAAVAYLRRRRLGPFRTNRRTAGVAAKGLGTLARAGFAVRPPPRRVGPLVRKRQRCCCNRVVRDG